MWAVLVGSFIAIASSALTTVSVDMSAIDRATYDSMQASGLYKSLLVRLVGDNLAFVNTGGAADIQVALSRPVGARLRIVVTTKLGSHETVVPYFGARNAEQAQLDVIHATLDLVRQARAALLTPPVLAAPPPTKVPEVSSVPKVAADSAYRSASDWRFSESSRFGHVAQVRS